MSNFPKIFNELVSLLAKFPGVGRRSAERMAFHVLKMSSDKVQELVSKIEEIGQYIKPCSQCNNFSSQDICTICADTKRDRELLCIVEEPKDILAIEKTGQYKGLYYVLLGSISLLDGVKGRDLNLAKLMPRLASEEIKEVVISTDPDNEGELTAQYLIEKISHFNLKIYRVAIGIPLGTQIEYIDSATLGKALIEKRQVLCNKIL